MHFSIVALLATACAVQAVPLSSNPHAGNTFFIKADAGQQSVLDSLDLDTKLNGNHVDIFATHQQLHDLKSADVAFDVIEESQPFIQKAKGNPQFEGYSDLQGIWDFLHSMEAAHPGLAKVFSLSDYLGEGLGVTFEGREFPVIKISDNAAHEEDEANVLFVSAHHSREIVTPQVGMHIVQSLLEGYESDDEIRTFVDNNEIFVAPLWNPDGYEHVWNYDNMWRKTRKPNYDGTYGVDLNRNYDVSWDAPCGGSSDPPSNTYRGESPNSEEETQTMVSFHSRRNFAKVMDFHSYGQEVLVSFRCTDIDPTIGDYSIQEGQKLADHMNYAVRVPSADGEHQQWGIVRTSAYSFLVETQTEFQPAFDVAVAEAERVWPGVLEFLKKPASVSGHVLDMQTKSVLDSHVSITVAELEGDEEISWSADERFGGYNIFLPEGMYELSFEAAGYGKSTHTVQVGESTVHLDIGLTKN
eukprot:Rmarinus@m.26331